MKLTKTFSRIVLGMAIASPVLAQTAPEDLVHPTVGTQNEGQTYPAVGMPFGMTHWTPQTRGGETKCVAPYYFTDARLQGFRGSHFVSGSCLPDYGSMTLMPLAGKLLTADVDRSSAFDRSSEHATPYEYSVELKDAGVRAAITGTSRAGMMQFTFLHADKNGWVVIENNSRGGDGWVRVDAARGEVTGEVPVRREYAGSGKLAGFSSYFVMQFDRPVKASGTWVGTHPQENGTEQRGDGKPLGVVTVAKMMTSTGGASAAATNLSVANTRPGFGVYVGFGAVQPDEIVLVRIGTSFVSVEEARKNLQAEVPDWNYAAVREKARKAWHDALEKIEVPANSPAATIFYTSMYHALLHPRTYSDVSGTYPRFASQGKVETARGFTYYDDFSMWDIFRAQLPMMTILYPKLDAEMMQSLVMKGEQGGFLPIFPAWSSYTSEMVGDHSTVAMIDAYSKGIRGFDVEKAYALMRRNATEIPASRAQYLDGAGRRGLDSYEKYGYIPLEDPISDAFHKNEQVSRTLEYAYDDAMLSRFARTLGRTKDAALFAKHGENWKNVIDPETGFARGRHADGRWLTPFDPAGKYTWITEGLPWQYTYFVPQNIPALIALQGGKQKFVERLDTLFSKHYYDHGNEPSHHIAYLYDAAGAPQKTQEHVRALMESEYKDGPDGLAGNDDAGQMSAWYVLGALGFYQVCPGVPEYWLGSPRFDDIRVHLPNGKVLHVVAKGAEAGMVHASSVTWNGKPLANWKLSHAALAAGGELRFQMVP